MAAPYGKAISGNAYKNNGATIVKAGAAVTTGENAPVTNSRTLLQNTVRGTYGSVVSLAVSPTSSGTIGTFNAMTTFGRKQGAREFMGIKLTSTINGTANSTLKMAAADFGNRRVPHPLETCRRLDEDSWDAESGAVTKGGSEGALSSFNADHAARPTNAVPGELTYRTGAPLAVNDDYKPRTST